MDRPDLRLLRGAIDMHAHTAPALFPRPIYDTDLAKMALDYGMRGFVLKDHDSMTATRAHYVKKLFPGIEPAGSDYIRITATNGVLPFELLGKGDEYVEGLYGQDAYAGAATLYSPHYAAGDGDYRSTLSIVNLGSTGGTVDLELIGDDGKQIAARRDIPIAARGKVYIADQNFFPNSDSSSSYS